MQDHEIKTVLMNALSLQEVHISTDGNYVQVIAIGEIFEDMDRVKKEQIVYAPLMEYITNNSIHAVSIRTFSPKEWDCINDKESIKFRKINKLP